MSSPRQYPTPEDNVPSVGTKLDYDVLLKKLNKEFFDRAKSDQIKREKSDAIRGVLNEFFGFVSKYAKIKNDATSREETLKVTNEAVEALLTQLDLPESDRDFTTFNEKLTAMEEKARGFEDSKNRFKRKLAKSLLVVGLALTAVALGALFFGLISPAIIPVASFGVSLAINGTFVGAGLLGVFMTIESSMKLGVDYKMPLLSQSLFALRDTMKDVKDGRDPNKVPLPRKLARAMR